VKSKRNGILVGFCLLIFVMNLIPLTQAQSLYQSYFWRMETGQPLSKIGPTGDFNSDHVQLSEVAVAGKGNVTILDGMTGAVLSHYPIAIPYSYSSLGIGNLDADSLNEIVVGSLDGGSLVVLDYNTSSGNLENVWEKSYNITQIRVADITGDLINEVLVSDSHGNITAFDKDGGLLWTVNLTEPIDNFKCLDFSQDAEIDRLLVLTNSRIALLNTSGDLDWQASLTSRPLNGVIGDVSGDSALELIIKGQNLTYCMSQSGSVLWNSSVYASLSPAILLHNSSDSMKNEILIAGNNGSYLLNGTTGSVFRKYLSNSSVNTLAIGRIFGDDFDYLVMGDEDRNLTIWNIEPYYDVIYLIMNITLTAPIVDLYLTDMNADDIPDMVIGTADGNVSVIGVPWLIDFNYVLIGIGIGAIVIVASIIIVMRNKRPSGPQKPAYHIK
jgi:hypothetical protein